MQLREDLQAGSLAAGDLTSKALEDRLYTAVSSLFAPQDSHASAASDIGCGATELMPPSHKPLRVALMLEAGLTSWSIASSQIPWETWLGALIRPKESQDFLQKPVIGLVWVRMR